VNLLHAAALALVGWYLMIPPPNFSGHSHVDLDAPLSKWTVYDAYDRSDDCNQAYLDENKIAQQKEAANPSDEKAVIQAHQLLNAQCIATDDPRLKGN